MGGRRRLTVYLTRDEAVAVLTEDGSSEDSARVTLDSPLAAWPQAHRTNFHLITRYEKGTVLGAWYPGNPGIPEPVWTIGRW